MWDPLDKYTNVVLDTGVFILASDGLPELVMNALSYFVSKNRYIYSSNIHYGYVDDRVLREVLNNIRGRIRAVSNSDKSLLYCMSRPYKCVLLKCVEDELRKFSSLQSVWNMLSLCL